MAEPSVVHPAKLDSQGLVFWYSFQSQEGLVRGTIFDSAIGDSDAMGIDR